MIYENNATANRLVQGWARVAQALLVSVRHVSYLSHDVRGVAADHAPPPGAEKGGIVINLNLFRVLSPTEQESQRQYYELQTWAGACRALGANPEHLAAYENAAQAYAATTLYPNSEIIAAARRAAQEALLHGEPLPQDVAAAVQAMWNREMGAWLDRL